MARRDAGVEASGGIEAPASQAANARLVGAMARYARCAVRHGARYCAWAIALALAAFHLYTATFGLLTPMLQRFLHLGGMSLLAILLWAPGKTRLAAYVNRLLFVAGVLFTIWMTWRLTPGNLLRRGVTGASELEVWAGVALLALVLEVTRRTIGWPIVIVGLASLAYALGGPYLPGILSHSGFQLNVLMEYLVWGDGGVFGIPLGASATFVILFILFGAVLEKLGAGDLFIRLAHRLTGHLTGGPAKTSALASAAMGSISGSAVSNVMTTGTFTIPLMTRYGYSPTFAAAVEAVASTGGQLMPPVMGAAAFVMAEVMGVSYRSVALAAVIPSLLYYAALFWMIDFEARKRGLKPQRSTDPAPLGRILRDEGYLLLPVALLVYLLVFQRYTVMGSAIWALYVGVALLVLQGLVRRRPLAALRALPEALESGVKLAVPVAAACATAGIIIGVVGITGIGVRFSQLVIELSRGELWLALVLTMVACMVLGMGLPTTAAYIITAVIGAPVLIDLGVPAMAAHFFILYFAIISFITPPVAIAAYAASGLARTNPVTTGFEAWRLGLAGYIVPFMFVYNPVLLGSGDWGTVGLSSLTALLGIMALAAAASGWCLAPVSYPERGMLLASSLLLIWPGIFTDLLGVLPALAVVGFRWRRLHGSKGKEVAARVPQVY